MLHELSVPYNCFFFFTVQSNFYPSKCLSACFFYKFLVLLYNFYIFHLYVVINFLCLFLIVPVKRYIFFLNLFLIELFDRVILLLQSGHKIAFCWLILIDMYFWFGSLLNYRVTQVSCFYFKKLVMYSIPSTVFNVCVIKNTYTKG